MRATIDRAGAFPVVQIPCHHFATPVKLDAPRAAVLHTTEVAWENALNEFKDKFAPQFLLGMSPRRKVEIVQLVPIGFIGAALETHNDHAIVQIEMVGFSKETLWLPDAETLDALASLMNVIRDEWGVPLSRPWKDGDYGRYGYHTPHRQAGLFGKTPGWFGHADIPDNEHWDPGNLSWDAVFARAKAIGGDLATPPAPAVHGLAWAQNVLNLIGQKPPLAVDGIAGQKTRDAIAKFQTTRKIFADGLLSPPTIRALESLKI